MADESEMYVEEAPNAAPSAVEADPILNSNEYSADIITHLKSVEVCF